MQHTRKKEPESLCSDLQASACGQSGDQFLSSVWESGLIKAGLRCDDNYEVGKLGLPGEGDSALDRSRTGTL